MITLRSSDPEFTYVFPLVKDQDSTTHVITIGTKVPHISMGAAWNQLKIEPAKAVLDPTLDSLETQFNICLSDTVNIVPYPMTVFILGPKLPYFKEPPAVPIVGLGTTSQYTMPQVIDDQGDTISDIVLINAPSWVSLNSGILDMRPLFEQEYETVH